MAHTLLATLNAPTINCIIKELRNLLISISFVVVVVSINNENSRHHDDSIDRDPVTKTIAEQIEPIRKFCDVSGELCEHKESRARGAPGALARTPREEKNNFPTARANENKERAESVKLA
jgi:hypothetical protein